MQDIRHVALYLRISQEKKGENIKTLDNHRQLLVDYAHANNYTYEEFGEVISGGKSELEDRKELLRLLENIEKFDAILCVELSRLSRNSLVSQTVKQYCMDYHKPIITPYQTYDLANSDNDRLMFDVGSMISSQEHALIGKRSKSNKIQMTKSGMHVGGGVPFGYRRNNSTKKLEIYEKEAQVVRYIFDLHSQGFGSFKIRDILNEEGYKTARGNHFSLPTIKRIIKNPHYKGWLVFHDRKRVKRNGKYTYDIVDSIVVKDAHPAIVPPHTWDKANEDRVERAEMYKNIRERPAVKTGVTMLKDLIFCGVCGRKMSIRKDKKSNTGYTVKKCEYLDNLGEKCINSGIRLVNVENAIHQELLEYKEELKSVLGQLKEEDSSKIKKDHEDKLRYLNKRIELIKMKEKGLIDLALNKVFSSYEIHDKKKEFEIQRRKLVAQRDALLETDIDVDRAMNDVKSILENIDNIHNLDTEEANQALKTFIKKIHYTRIIPKEILKLSTRNKKRKLYPFDIKVEYFNL